MTGRLRMLSRITIYQKPEDKNHIVGPLPGLLLFKSQAGACKHGDKIKV